MNNPALRTGFLIAAAAVVVLLYASVFTVGQMQQALVLQFGRVRAVLNQTGTDKPGLYFKVPFMDNVVLFDKRVLDLDLPVQTLLTADRQNLEVDAFARYRIIDPLKFYQSANNILRANTLLASFTNSALRNVLARSTRDAIVRTQRSDLMNQIQGDVNRQAKELGVEIVDLRMTRVDLPAQN
ncbi:MAG: protease modulator HflC, partial [Propionibacteriaceae bacterium]